MVFEKLKYKTKYFEKLKKEGWEKIFDSKFINLFIYLLPAVVTNVWKKKKAVST